jgi:hypothetical protein
MIRRRDWLELATIAAILGAGAWAGAAFAALKLAFAP